ncbi:CBS domain-containing protein [Corynebacterium sp. zg912]|uniref:CBS domain-containing protein n=1 Tax=Corynebacterium wankanglinii TaxID=2735136 RepID=A0A7H0K8K7_9CORY|nr:MULTISPECIES: CBS domain-containing protein [Corynebacterium]MBA1837037.1 CBS domain-containing protein [Corynebacterium wankanglinii]MCR5928012.1 CBS domain-containing protein [Corynebacterium sp. zg912]QNP93623.1 CBS domain-containing protein [Corynebacterium wankanglinii]
MSNAETNRAVPFLAAFNAIEKFLRDQLDAKKSDSFTWMTRLAAKRGILTSDQSDTLREFADLRNAISHGEYEDLRPIAEPLPETVAQIERLRDELLAPTLALEVIEHQRVISFSPSSDIHEPLAMIAAKGITQFPVYDDGKCVGLLTTNAIARWVAAELRDDDTIATATIADVLAHSGKLDQPIFLHRTVTAAAAVEALSTPLPTGAVPRLAIITEHGKPTQRPISVLAATDIPTLAQAM